MTESRHATLIVLCWNRWDLTRRCLDSLRAHTDLTKTEVLAVDNGSTDETPVRLAGYDWLRVLTLPRNLGYVRGNNHAIARAAPGNDVVLLNNDVEFIQDGWLDRLSAAAHASPDVGIVGCRLVLPDGRLLHAGTYILPDTMWGQQVGSTERDLNQFSYDREVQGIVFACAYIKRETIQAIGSLSEDFESYFEDTDYALRAREAGFRTICCGSVTVMHHEHGSTSTDPANFRRMFDRSRSVFEKKWKTKLQARYQRDFHWQSILNFPTGYAMSCRELIRELDGLGVRSSYEYVYGPGTPYPPEEPEDAGDYLLNVVAKREPPARPPVSIVYGQGDVFNRNRGRYRIGYTMLEVDGFPNDWVSQANQMDEVWVPTSFNRDALLRCGLRRPVHVMPLGVAVDRFNPRARGFPNPHGDFVFLANFEWGERKAPELLLQAFNETFRSDEKVILLCKVINRNPDLDLRSLVASLGLRTSGGRVAFLFNREFPYYQLPALYRSADCFISAGRGEGWDMPLMEAMACGLPTIATDWGSHTEFVSERYAYPLRIRGTIPAVARCPYYTGFSWADPDMDHLSELLRRVFEKREESSEKGRLAAAEMSASWTWRHAARRIRDRLGAIAA